MKQIYKIKTLIAIAVMFFMTSTAFAAGGTVIASGTNLSVGPDAQREVFNNTLVHGDINRVSVRFEATFSAQGSLPNVPLGTANGGGNRWFAMFLQLANAQGDPIDACLTVASRVDAVTGAADGNSNRIQRFAFGMGARTGADWFLESADAFGNGLRDGTAPATFGAGISNNSQLNSTHPNMATNTVIVYASISGTTLTASITTNGTRVGGANHEYTFTVPAGSQIGSFHAWMRADADQAARLNISSWEIRDMAGPPPPTFASFEVTPGGGSLIAGVVDSDEETVTIAVPFGTNLTDMGVTFTTDPADVPVYVGSNPITSGVFAQTFVDETPVNFVLTPAEGSPVNYKVTVNVGADPDIPVAPALATFSVGGVAGTITGQNISVVLPFTPETTLPALPVAFTFADDTDAVESVTIGTETGFASGSNFTFVAGTPTTVALLWARGSDVEYTVTVTIGDPIIAYGVQANETRTAAWAALPTASTSPNTAIGLGSLQIEEAVLRLNGTRFGVTTNTTNRSNRITVGLTNDTHIMLQTNVVGVEGQGDAPFNRAWNTVRFGFVAQAGAQLTGSGNFNASVPNNDLHEIGITPFTGNSGGTAIPAGANNPNLNPNVDGNDFEISIVIDNDATPRTVVARLYINDVFVVERSVNFENAGDRIYIDRIGRAQHAANERVETTWELTTDTRGTVAKMGSLTIGGVAATVNQTAETATAMLPYGASLENIPVTFAVSRGATLNVGGTDNPTAVTFPAFETAVNFVVTAEYGDPTQAVRTYAVTVTEAAHTPPSFATFAVRRVEQNDTIILTGSIHNDTIEHEFPVGTNLEELVPIFTLAGDPAAVTYGTGTAVVSGVTVIDFTSDVTFTLTPTVGTVQIPVLYVTDFTVSQQAVPPFFTEFTVAGVDATINNDNTITVEVPYRAGLESLVVTFEHEGDPAHVYVNDTRFASGSTQTFPDGSPGVVFILRPDGVGGDVIYTVTVTLGEQPPALDTVFRLVLNNPPLSVNTTLSAAGNNVRGAFIRNIPGLSHVVPEMRGEWQLAGAGSATETQNFRSSSNEGVGPATSAEIFGWEPNGNNRTIGIAEVAGPVTLTLEFFGGTAHANWGPVVPETVIFRIVSYNSGIYGAYSVLRDVTFGEADSIGIVGTARRFTVETNFRADNGFWIMQPNWANTPTGDNAQPRPRLRVVSFEACIGPSCADLGTQGVFNAFAVNGVSITPEVYPGTTMTTELPYATNFEAIAVTFTEYRGATVTVADTVITNGHLLDFTDPVLFRVVSEDLGDTNFYRVSLTRTPASEASTLLTFSANGNTIIPTTPEVMTYELPYGTTLNDISVVFTASEFAVVTVDNQVDPLSSPATVDFTSGTRTFTVTSQAGVAFYTEYVVTLTVNQDVPDPITELPFYWHTQSPIPVDIVVSENRTPDYTAIGYSRPMLGEEGDYFIVDFSGVALNGNRSLVSTEFRWGARSIAQVVVYESADGIAWTALDTIANTSATASPGSAVCIDVAAGAAAPILFVMDAGSDGLPRFAKFQTLLSPNARFVRYSMIQQGPATAGTNVNAFMVQAVEIREHTHTTAVVTSDFSGFSAGSQPPAAAMTGGTMTVSGTVMVNNPTTHPCAFLGADMASSVRFGGNGNWIQIALDEPIHFAGELVLTLAQQTQHNVNVQLEYRTSTTGQWILFNDTAWVMSAATQQRMHFEFPQVTEGIRYFRILRNPVTGGAAATAQTFFVYNIGVNVSVPAARLALGEVTFAGETLRMAPWVFTVPNDPTLEINRVDIDVVSMVPDHTDRIEDVTTVWPLVFNSEAMAVFRLIGTGMFAGETTYDTVRFVKDTELPAIVANSPNALGHDADDADGRGLGATGTIVLTWNKPIQALAGNTGNVMIGAREVTNFVIDGNELSIPFIATDWSTNEMLITIEANTFTDLFNNVNEVAGPFVYTRDVTAPVIARSFPVNNSTTAPMAGGIMLTFSEPIHQATVQENMNQITLNGAPLPSGFFFNSANQIFVPYRELAANRTHTLVVPASIIVDLAGNNLAANYTLTFTTGQPLRLDGTETFTSGDAVMNAQGHDFAVPAWITTAVRSALVTAPTGPAQAYRVIGFNPDYREGSTVLTGPGAPAAGGAYRLEDTLVFHFDAIGELELWLTSNGTRAYAMWTNLDPTVRRVSTDTLSSTNISDPANLHLNADLTQHGANTQVIWRERFNISEPVRVFLAAYANAVPADTSGPISTGILNRVIATAAPLNPVGEFITFTANTQPVTVVAQPEPMTHELWFGANLAEVNIEFTVSHNATVTVAGNEVNSGTIMPFTDQPVIFRVVSEDLSDTTFYNVSFTIANPASIATFEVNWELTSINANERTITGQIGDTEDITNVTVIFTTVPELAIARVDGELTASGGTGRTFYQDFTNAVEFEVRNPEGGDFVTYIVTITQGGASIQPGLEIEVVSFYPNPATDVLNITANNIRMIEIINMMGTIVISTSGSGNNHTLDISSLNSGLHFVRVTTDTGVSVGRFIKQ